MTIKTTFRFGELEAILADLNGVQSHQRTAFQARLKNFHRLNFPADMETEKGKATVYSVRDLIQMAVAVELTQLGLTPERAIDVFNDDPYPVWMAVMMSASALIRQPNGFSPEWADHETTDPDSMFLYFDPAALVPWDEGGTDRASSTFFFGGVGAVRENLTRWTTGPTRRIALINVTAMVWQIAAYVAGEDGVVAFVQHIQSIATDKVLAGDFDLDGWLMTVAKSSLMMSVAQPKWLKEEGEVGWIWLKDYGVPKAFRPFISVPKGKPTLTQPDMLIHLPGQRTLTVDAKVTPLADKPQQAIRSRVEKLATDNPYRTPFTDNTAFVVLYVPSEKFFTDAVAVDRDLIAWALDQKVVIATPSNLMFLLSEVGMAWDDHLKTEDGKEEFVALKKWGKPDGYR